MTRSNELYLPRYGEWAGRPNGVAPNYDRCCVQVYSTERGVMHHQCLKKRGHGPDEAYCAAHDPEAVKARADKAAARYRLKHDKDMARWYAPIFLETLRKIAGGHNDARGLATEIVSKFEESIRR